jgi:lysophospholipase L1-like esterase
VLRNLPDWLGSRRYDVIHFNCGLHDLKRAHEHEHLQVPLAEYEANLRAIIDQMRQGARTLIWARTTPVTDGQPEPSKPFDRFNADVDAYNAVADRVMQAAGITLNDLHSVIVGTGRERAISADGVHMTAFGTELLAARVTAAIRAALQGAQRVS